MKNPTFKRKNGTTLHYRTGKDGKKHLDLKTEWNIAEDRVLRFKNWLLGEK